MAYRSGKVATESSRVIESRDDRTSSSLLHSAWKRQKDESEQKRTRDEEETKRVYQEFVTEFEAEDDKSRYNDLHNISKGSSMGMSKSFKRLALPIHAAHGSSSIKKQLKLQDDDDHHHVPHYHGRHHHFPRAVSAQNNQSDLHKMRMINLPRYITTEALDDLFKESKQSYVSLMLSKLSENISNDPRQATSSANIFFDQRNHLEDFRKEWEGLYIGEGCFCTFESFEADTDAPPKLPFNAKILSEGAKIFPPLEIDVIRPISLTTLRRVNRTVEYVLRGGIEFESSLMTREKFNPNFAFLFDTFSPEHVYYRWRLFSLASAETPYRYSTEKFQMFFGGAWWVPPVQLEDGDDDEDDVDLDDTNKLSKGRQYLGSSRRMKLEWILRQMSYRRGTIARGMGFAVENADCADEVVNIILSSFNAPDTPTSDILARLYLISDIIHISTAQIPNVWKYRQFFEIGLVQIFEKLSAVYLRLESQGRIKADNFKRAVFNLFEVWDEWMVFGSGILDNYVEKFTGDSSFKLQKSNKTIGTSDHGSGDSDSRNEPELSTNGSWKTVRTKTAKPNQDLTRLIDDELDGIPFDLSFIDTLPDFIDNVHISQAYFSKPEFMKSTEDRRSSLTDDNDKRDHGPNAPTGGDIGSHVQNTTDEDKKAHAKGSEDQNHTSPSGKRNKSPDAIGKSSPGGSAEKEDGGKKKRKRAADLFDY